MLKKTSIFFLMFSMLLLVSCRTKAAPPVQSTVPPVQSAVQPTQSTTSTVQKNAPPAQVNSIESNAEDIIDDITNNKWEAAQSKVSDIKTNFSGLKPMLVSASISNQTIDGLNSAVAGLETAVSAKKSYDSRVQANHISKYVPDIADQYMVTLPTDIGRLDYLGREINLNVENSDWPAANSNYEIAKSLWGGLKSKLNATYKNHIDSFQSNMDNLKTAIDKKAADSTTSQANTLLENIDVLEKDFTEQSKK